MRIKVVIEKINNKTEHFSFIVSQYNISTFFENFFDFFENFEDVNVRFIKSEESEE